MHSYIIKRIISMAMQTEITMEPITAGTFCWNELAVWDTEIAAAFYCALFGWTIDTNDQGPMPYTMFKMGEHPVCGMILMDADWPEDCPSHWGCYISSDDVDATAKKAIELGGTLCCEPQEGGDEDRFAVITDPTGAVVSVFKGGDGKNPNGHGSFCWNELLTNDVDKATEFYTSLLGWTAVPSGTSEEPYTVLMKGEVWVCGMMKMHWEGNPSWLGYVSVASVDESIAKAIELGATVCVEPSDMPGIGRFAVFTDPTGATIAIFTAVSECCGDSCGCSNE
jgi:predicted enzyme related to lactoylglutathione lyase